jgi:copper chaperone CopZ
LPKLVTAFVVFFLAAFFLAWPAAAPAAERTEILYIPAITCGSKAIQAEVVLRQLRGVTGAMADVMEAAATVTWDEEAVTLEDIMASLSRNGFPVASVGRPPAQHAAPEEDPADSPPPQAPSAVESPPHVP